MQKTCRQCSAQFEITDDDLTFYEKISPVFGGKRYDVPPPTLCPECRQQRRAAQFNELALYKRPCDLTKKMIITNFHPANPHTVYSQDAWHSDRWDPLSYGHDMDFSRTFFEQHAEICDRIPHPALFTGYQYDENSDYTNYAGKNKNCYLLFDSDENRDCYYGYSLNGSRDCMDCFRVRTSELCYECIDCLDCYSSVFLQECHNCSDSAFLKGCIGCKNCLMCVNLQNKEYYVENKPVSPKEFEAFRKLLSSHARALQAKKHFADIKLRYPHKYLHGTQNENVEGDYLTNSKNVRMSFDGSGLWDCAYMFRTFYPCTDSMDCEAAGGDERLYECSVVGYNAAHALFSANCLDRLSELLYSTYCFRCSSLFGCVGLRQKQYCVLNKQYTKEEYEKLVPRIIDHMRTTGEWGEFFPVHASPFGYNESGAQEYYPLSKEEVLARGWKWQEGDVTESQYLGPPMEIPDDSGAASASITGAILRCETSGELYKIIPQELDLCRKLSVPLPLRSFKQRHRDRIAQRNPRKLWNRACDNCGTAIKTTFDPKRPESVFCETCYQQSLS